MRKVSNANVKPGFVLLKPIQDGYGDGASGLVYQTVANMEGSVGVVIGTRGMPDEYKPGDEVVYRRVVAIDIRLYDEHDVENTYKIVQIEDIITTFDKEDESESGV